MTDTLRAAAERALEALDDMIERVAFACGENEHSASRAARPIADALRAALAAEQPQSEAEFDGLAWARKFAEFDPPAPAEQPQDRKAKNND